MAAGSRRRAGLAAVCVAAALAGPTALAQDRPGERDLAPPRGDIRDPLVLAGFTLTDGLAEIRDRFPGVAVRRAIAERTLTRVPIRRATAQIVEPEATRSFTFLLTGAGRLYEITERASGPGVACDEVFSELKAANGPPDDSQSGYRGWQRVGVDQRQTLVSWCADGRAAVSELDDPLILRSHARAVEAEREHRQRDMRPKVSVPRPFR